MLGVQHSGSAVSTRGGGGARGGGDMVSDLLAGSTTGANEAKDMALAARMNFGKQQQQLSVG